MAKNLYREYKIKCYLNARHYIIINDRRGAIHPHTWEFTFTIRFSRSEFKEFTTFEKGLADYLAPFQNTIINENEPFDAIVPTLENMVDYFVDDFINIIDSIGGILLQVEASETPTRSYVVDLSQRGEEDSTDARERILSDVMDSVLDNILD